MRVRKREELGVTTRLLVGADGKRGMSTETEGTGGHPSKLFSALPILAFLSFKTYY